MKYLIIACLVFWSLLLHAQVKPYTFEECVEYALENGTDIKRSQNNLELQEAYLNQSKASRLPNLQLGVNQQFEKTSIYDNSTGTWGKNDYTSLNASIGSKMTIYNGGKIKNLINQSKNNAESAQYSLVAAKEQISLEVLSAFIDVLYAKENLQNKRLQLEESEKQYEYAKAKYEAGTLSRTDFLNVKSQVATDKTNLAEAESNYRMMLVSLMQVINMPVQDDFTIVQPDVDSIVSQNITTNPEDVYSIALEQQPNIKAAALNLKSAEVGVEIAKAQALPNLSLSAGLGTSFNSEFSAVDFGNQLTNRINPYVGISLSIPVFQQKQAKTSVKVARIQSKDIALELMEIKNNLRKSIEQACSSYQTAQTNFMALQEALEAEQESYNLASEKFAQGMVNSFDLLLSKNNLVKIRNKFIQAKYNLVLQKKIIEYYLGEQIKL
ncbi:TolC family protein [Tenuifilum thalassicum]|uniref:TolC family protein n=1 Tax=Tenuifilum thalassicum TaxID=2590900 RepID=A0A7D4BDG7_9BACT|nr:TolC family protein [Tenuifilum thalassicum]QKG79318.1 TolC family protein [Tenuifilum thalassicum]